MITDLGHPAFAAHDVDETIGFYGMLGIEEAFRLHNDDGSLMLVYLHVSGDRFIEVFPGGPAPEPGREQSFKHICLLTADLHAAVENLRENGVPIDREPAVATATGRPGRGTPTETRSNSCNSPKNRRNGGPLVPPNTAGRRHYPDKKARITRQ
jgi:catechol 2,3-dioxygenase-like lactoylglutathione lyase family enzyme